MKKLYSITAVIVLMILIGTVQITYGATGYIYKSDGRPMFAEVGYSVNSNGIFDIQSERWHSNNFATNMNPNDFKDPAGLFVYEEDNGDYTVYVTDKGSSKIFVFDTDLNLTGQVPVAKNYDGNNSELYIKINPNDWKDRYTILPNGDIFYRIEELKTQHRVANSGGDYNSVTYFDINANNGINRTTPAGVNYTYAYSLETFFKNEAGSFNYMVPNGITGIFRGKRQVYDETGTAVLGKFEDIIYLCDTKSNQILLIDAKTYRLIDFVSQPQAVNYKNLFTPTSIVALDNGIMYVISDGTLEGIMKFDRFGEFKSYVGTNYVTLSFWEAFRKNFQSEEQRAQATPILNTVFTSMALDQFGFIYVTSRAYTNPVTNVQNSNNMIKLLGPNGKDVLVRNGYHPPKGDVRFVAAGGLASMRGPSQLYGVATNKYGLYSVIDQKMGRIFTYDKDGFLLYISGGSGVEYGDINLPVGICYMGESLIVLENKTSTLLKFEPTETASIINRASKLYFENKLNESSEVWKNVIARNPNYEYAYIGVGKTLFNQGRYQEAMDYFKTGYSISYYSKAFKSYRDEVIREWFPPIVISLAILIVGLNVLKIVRKRKRKVKKNEIVEEGYA